MKLIDIFGMLLAFCAGIGLVLLAYLSYQYVPELMWFLFGVVSGVVFTIFIASFQYDDKGG